MSVIACHLVLNEIVEAVRGGLDNVDQPLIVLEIEPPSRDPQGGGEYIYCSLHRFICTLSFLLIFTPTSLLSVFGVQAFELEFQQIYISVPS
jgi:hypothetical protein